MEGAQPRLPTASAAEDSQARVRLHPAALGQGGITHLHPKGPIPPSNLVAFRMDDGNVVKSTARVFYYTLL